MIFNVGKNGGIKVDIVFENDTLDCSLFNHLKEKKLFEGKLKEVFISTYNEKIFLGLGKKEELYLENVREAFFTLSKKLIENKVNEIELFIPKFEGICNKELAMAISEGMMQAEYSFDRFKSDKKDKLELTVNYIPEKKADRVQEGIDESKKIVDSIFISRDLVNLPANYIYPETLANKVVELLTPLGVKVTVYDKKQIESMKMDAFLSVAKGSDNEPRFIVMEYLNNEDSDERLGLVGKGITYDSGGYSLKPSDSMKTMFCDMGGAGTVIGTMHAIASQKLKKNVVAVIAACENMVSGHSYKPGDIINSLSGKTIEVDNTDAEGRLTLADAVYYTVTSLKATKIIDLATLTGACLVALGEIYTGAVTNNQEFFANIKKSSEEVGEKIWQLPSDKLFAKMNESKVADIKNIGGRFGGTITAGLFVGEFVENTPWVHLDIAGTAYLSKPYSYLPLGATGIHVKTLYRYVKYFN